MTYLKHPMSQVLLQAAAQQVCRFEVMLEMTQEVMQEVMFGAMVYVGHSMNQILLSYRLDLVRKPQRPCRQSHATSPGYFCNTCTDSYHPRIRRDRYLSISPT